MDDFLIRDGRVVSHSLEVLLVGWLEEFLTLWEFPVLLWRSAILEGCIWYVSLLVEGVCPVVAGGVEMRVHPIKLWDCGKVFVSGWQ